MRPLADLIAFNEANAERELRWFGQEIFLLAEATGGLDDPAYTEALATSRRVAREGIDGTLDRFDLGAIFSLDRKSTRLNSSHANISHAVFCLKKNKHPLLSFDHNG